jgi:YD repeat-containing protein
VGVFVMIRRLFVAVLIVLVLQCALNGSARAQIGMAQTLCYIYPTANDLGIDLGSPVPAWAELFQLNYVFGLGGMTVFRVHTADCAPIALNETKCSDCDGAAGRPISLADGNTYIKQTDVAIPGLGGGLSLVRTWNSVWPSTQISSQIGMFGPNWRSTFEERVFVGSDRYIKYARSDGSFWSFGASAGSWVLAAPKNGSVVTLTVPPPASTTNWTLSLKNGEQRVFDGTTGQLLSITDRNGNITQLTYDTSHRLVTVTDPAARHLYFGYGSPTSLLVTSVTSDFGMSLSYAYDTSGRLTQVTEPDSNTLNFAYNSMSLITSVTDTDGKVLESHTYDSIGRGLTSARAGGVESLTIAY